MSLKLKLVVQCDGDGFGCLCESTADATLDIKDLIDVGDRTVPAVDVWPDLPDDWEYYAGEYHCPAHRKRK